MNLERFRAKWAPVRVKKTRQNKRLEPRSDLIGTEKVLVRLCLALAAFLLTTKAGLADDVLGTWLRDNGNVRVRFEPCDDAICGNIVWLKPGSDSKAKVGQRLFFDMRPAGANSWIGKAANPDTGSIYSGKMSVEGATLSTSGCIVGGLVCKSANWRRVP